MKPFIYIVAVGSLLLIATFPISSQQQAEKPVTQGYGLSLEQSAKIEKSLRDSTDLTALADRVAAARKEALEAALDKNATDAAVQAKIEEVAKLQIEIAMLRYRTGVKDVLPSVTDDQRSQMLETSAVTYSQLFVGKTSGLGFTRGGKFTPNSKSEK